MLLGADGLALWWQLKRSSPVSLDYQPPESLVNNCLPGLRASSTHSSYSQSPRPPVMCEVARTGLGTHLYWEDRDRTMTAFETSITVAH